MKERHPLEELSLPSEIDIREVGPRDGLQPERPLEPAQRMLLIESLLAAGARHLEVAAFVSPKAVPAMAGAAEVVAATQHLVAAARAQGQADVVLAALVPNTRGAEMALQSGVDELTVTISISETYNQRNVRMSLAESEGVIAQICSLAGAIPVDAVVSCAFGSPYEGDIPADSVGELGERLRSAGCAGITYADTTGMATPARIAAVLSVTGPDVGLHLHDTRGTALVNAYAAMQWGVQRFDTSVGGLGGSPFAHGSSGNLATEELVALADDLSIVTGFNIDRLVESAELVAGLVGHPVPSRVALAGPRGRRAVSAE